MAGKRGHVTHMHHTQPPDLHTTSQYDSIAAAAVPHPTNTVHTLSAIMALWYRRNSNSSGDRSTIGKC
jgi:hypothetical protein